MTYQIICYLEHGPEIVETGIDSIVEARFLRKEYEMSHKCRTEIKNERYTK